MVTERGAPLVVDLPGRLDAFVAAACPSLSRRLVRRLIDDGLVRVNERPASRGARLAPGDRVALPPVALEPEPELPVGVVYVDEHLVVVDKPGGMPGHALDPRQRGTVAGVPRRTVSGDGRGGRSALERSRAPARHGNLRSR